MRPIFVISLGFAAACGDDTVHHLDGGEPVVVITSPVDGSEACPPTVVEFTTAGSAEGLTVACTLDGVAQPACASPLALTGLAAGAHTLTIVATNVVGTADASVTFSVTATPSISVVATAGAINSGTATLAVTTVPAGLAVTADACICDAGTCECNELSAGTNHLVAKVDAGTCGTVEAAVDVVGEFGPYKGHAIVIGHDYSDATTPDLVGNAVGLANIGKRNVIRVLAWRPPGVEDDTVTNVRASIDRVLGERTLTADYLEITDATQIVDALRGRDVLLAYEVGEAFNNNGELDALADAIAPALVAFTNAGGIAIDLDGGYGWRLFGGGTTPIIAVTDGYPTDGTSGTPYQVAARHPASLIGGVGYALLDGIGEQYDTPIGSGCLVADDSVTVIADHVAAECSDGCNYISCAAIIDQRMPRVDITVTPAFDTDSYPACVPDGMGLASGGSFAVSVAGGTAPTGTFACTYAAEAGYLASPEPTGDCTITAETYALALASAPHNEAAFVDVTLLDGDGVPLGSGRASIRVDEDLFISPSTVPANACTATYLIREYLPQTIDATCTATLPQSYLPVSAVDCTLERETSPGVFAVIDTRTGTGCGAIAAPGGGFESGNAVVDWSSSIIAANATGNLRYTATITDYHGNVKTNGRAWALSSTTFCN